MPDAPSLLSVFRSEPGPLSDGTAAFPFDPPVVGEAGDVRWSDLVYSAEPGFRPLFLDLRVPATAAESPAPVVVWIHGGGWVHGTRRRRPPNLHASRVVERIVEAGFAVALVDYRLAAEAPFPAPALDLKAAIRWLRAHAGQFGLDASRVALWGESAGAHLATLTGLCRRLDAEPRTGEFLEQSEEVQAVVDWYGPADLAGLVLDAHAESEERGAGDPLVLLTRGTDWTPEELSPIRYVRPDAAPLFIAHGAQDRLVPVEQSRMLHRALQELDADVEYLETDGDHVFVGAPVVAEVTDRSIDFLRRRMTGEPARPALDPQVAAMEERMTATGMWPLLEGVPAEEARTRGIVMRRDFYPPKPFKVASVTDSVVPGPAGDIPVRVTRPEGEADATVVYTHGGGWIIGDLDSHAGSAARIAATARAVVVQMDYRLAPEHRWPAGLDDARAVAEWVLAHVDEFGGDPATFVLAGDSAGGNITAVLAQEFADRGLPVAAQLLVYPATDLTTVAGAPVGLDYLGPNAAELVGNPRVSPALAPNLAALPPTVIGVGAHDFLYADNVAYVEKLRAAGVEVVFRDYPTLNHGFFSYGSVSPAADQAADLLCRDLARIVHGRP
ncbi:MAG TPA: alpha/beta hydrolase fold domain-containing protein [Geodermatophilus sp.]|nr:alpha/beta hydrolase fold domain-containing protein [Geodermatophilus sp.]